MGTARWAGGRSLQERREAGLDHLVPPRGAPSPWAAGPVHRSPRVNTRSPGCSLPLPTQGLRPPSLQSAADLGSQVHGEKDPMGPERSNDELASTFNCFAFAILIETSEKRYSQYPHFIDGKTEAGRWPLPKATHRGAWFGTEVTRTLISTQHRPGSTGSLAPSLLWDPEQVTSFP